MEEDRPGQEQQQQQPLPPSLATTTTMSRRASLASASSQRSHQSSVGSRGPMTEMEQDERRKQIKEIMKDTKLSQQDKSKSIQQLMDGRRKSISSCGASTQSASSTNSGTNNNNTNHNNNNTSSHDNDDPAGVIVRTGSNYVTNMAAAAAAAAEYYSSDDDADGDMRMMMMDDDYYEYNMPDDISYGYERANPDDRSVNSEITNPDSTALSHLSRATIQAATQQAHNNNASLSEFSTNFVPPQGTYRQVHGRSFSLQDWSDNDRAAAAAHTSIFTDNPEQINRLMEKSRPVCEHYERNCTIISPCCGLAFGCRICHDECPVLPPPLQFNKSNNNNRNHQNNRNQCYVIDDDGDVNINTTMQDLDNMDLGGGGGGGSGSGSQGAAASGAGSGSNGMFVDKMDSMKRHAQKAERRRSMPIDFEDEEENHHLIDRFAIREILCRKCYTRQSSKTNKCMACGEQFGTYHCQICNLWMSNKEAPYHCLDCGFCRVGGRDNFRHCHDCGMCIDTLLFDDHNCKAGKYMSNCPICQEDLFSSRFASHEMPCGHAIHWHCFRELTSYDTRCPVCKKTAETPEQMAATWSAIAMGIALQPVPPDLARVVSIVCNDCEEHDSNRRWHFLGVRCMKCLSFNTSVEQTHLQGRDAAEFLDRLDAIQVDNHNTQSDRIGAAGTTAAAGGGGGTSPIPGGGPSSFGNGGAATDAVEAVENMMDEDMMAGDDDFSDHTGDDATGGR